jgi:hypothetical protein
MKTKESYWIVGTLLIAALLTGLLFDFNYMEYVDIQLHDTYFVVLPVYCGLALWLILTFVVFLIVGMRARFAKILSTWILLLTNSLLIILTSLLTYWVYAIFILDLSIDIFRETKRVDVVSQQFNQIIAACVVLIILLLAGEFFLIRRLVRLRRAK